MTHHRTTLRESAAGPAKVSAPLVQGDPMSQNTTKLPCPQTESKFPISQYATLLVVALLFWPAPIKQSAAQAVAHDPGVRGGPPGAGGAIAGLTPNQKAFFDAGQA